MSTIQQGAYQAVNNCMKITSKDKVLIVTDTKTLPVANSILKESVKITSTELINLDQYGKRPLISFPKELKSKAEKATAVFYMAEQFKGEKEKVTKAFLPLPKSKTETVISDMTYAHLDGLPCVATN